jgi:hypothetical protein
MLGSEYFSSLRELTLCTFSLLPLGSSKRFEIIITIIMEMIR